MEAEARNKAAGEALESEPTDRCSARSFFSNDFEWETLRSEIEDSPREDCETLSKAMTRNSSSSVILEDEAFAYEEIMISLSEPSLRKSVYVRPPHRYFPEDEVSAFEINHIYSPEPPKTCTCSPNRRPDGSGQGYVLCARRVDSGSAFKHGGNLSLDFSHIAWEAFHKNHSKALFFKERRYLVKEFPELLSASTPSFRILEVGCGTGSSVVPILRANEKATVYGCDCSPFALQRAVEVAIQEAVDFVEPHLKRFYPFLCDVSSDTFPSWLCCSTCREPKQVVPEEQRELSDEENSNVCTLSESSSSQPCRLPPQQRCLGGVNIATLIFTLSSIPPENMQHVLIEIASVLRPGGWLLFRDYGLYDLTMLRFPPSQKVSERLYHRKDGTLSYFFSLDFVRNLFTNCGLVEDELHYCCVQLRNRRTQLLMKRVWIHAKFRKPGELDRCSFSGS